MLLLAIKHVQASLTTHLGTILASVPEEFGCAAKDDFVCLEALLSTDNGYVCVLVGVEKTVTVSSC